jgi:hypothetical protein
MGGKSRQDSNQTTQSAQTSINNDGEFAGASNFALDNSDKSVNESFNTSTVLEESFNTTNVNEYDNSIEDSFNTSNTDESDNSIDDSFNTTDESDNSIDDSFNTTDESDNSLNFDGDFAANSGTVNITDGGIAAQAFEFAGGAVDEAFATVENTARESLNAAREANEGIRQISSESLDFGRDAIDSLSGFQISSIEAISGQSRDFAENIKEFASLSGESISMVASDAIAGAQDQVSAANQSNSENLEAIAKLAASTTSGGQSIIAESSQKIILYIAVALAFIGGSFALASK